jgi:hypothetical protein
MIFIVLLIYFVKVMEGFLIIHLIWDSREIKSLILKLFLGAGMAMGVASLFYFLWFWFHLSPSNYPYFEGVLLVVLIIIVWKKEQNYGTNWVLQVQKPTKRILIWLSLTCFSIIFCVARFIFDAFQNPHGVDDAWTIWNLGARFIYRLDSNSWFNFISDKVWFHTDYPLFMALNIAEGWSILSLDSILIPIVISLIFVVSIIGLVFSSLAIVKDTEQGALAAILIASVPWLTFLASWQYADLPLSYFFLATGVLLYIYTIQHDHRLLLLAGFYAGVSAWTKNEGVMFVLITFSVCLILDLSRNSKDKLIFERPALTVTASTINFLKNAFTRSLLSLRRRNNQFKYFLQGLIFPALVIVLFKSITPPNDLFVDKTKSFLQLFDSSRYQIIFSKMGVALLSFGGWSISFVAILAIYAFLVCTKPDIKGKIWVPFFIFSFQFAGYFLIYLITPHDLINHLDTSLNRLFFHLFPLAIFLLFNFLPSPHQIFTTNVPAK